MCCCASARLAGRQPPAIPEEVLRRVLWHGRQAGKAALEAEGNESLSHNPSTIRSCVALSAIPASLSVFLCRCYSAPLSMATNGLCHARSPFPEDHSRKLSLWQHSLHVDLAR